MIFIIAVTLSSMAFLLKLLHSGVRPLFVSSILIQTLYDMKDNNETASFLFNVLEPLIAERWQERDFGGYATTNYVASDNATLEYQLTMTARQH